jgi:hypothetical protein
MEARSAEQFDHVVAQDAPAVVATTALDKLLALVQSVTRAWRA